ncbi:MAG: ABC transporter ATP-binding protein [Phycisphaeraceae bacterium]|nr:MAG: ABC transporter ATP-binding protein [Phycisphaeraceae bacterium]
MLKAEQLTIAFAGPPVIDRVSLEVSAEQVVGVLGHNGSGKTTLLRAAYRVLRPDSGSVLIEGRDVWRMSSMEAARAIGSVAQDQSLAHDMTIRELVSFGRFPHKQMFEPDTPADQVIIDEAISRVGLSALAGRRLSELSGGERQRAMIAKGLAQQPRVLVLDEPTNHLDVRYQIDLLELVRQLRIAVVVTLHDLNLAAAYCDKLYVLAHGKVVAEGSVDAVLTDELIRDVFGVSARRGINPLTGRPHIYFGQSQSCQS